MAGRRGGNGKQKPPFLFPRVESVARPTGAVRELRYWVQTYQSAQKFRIVGGNRLSAWERQADTAEEVLAPSAGEMQGTAQGIEAQAYGEIKRLLKTMPVWTDWLRHVKGIDVALGGALLALLLPPRADKTVASWFKAAGLDVVNAPPRSDPGLSAGKAVVSENDVGPGGTLVSESTLGPGAAVASGIVLGADGCVASGSLVGSDQALARGSLVGCGRGVVSGKGVGAGQSVADETGEAAAPAKRRHPAETDPLAPHLPRFTKGEQPTWHPQLRKTLYLVGESFVRSGGYYREFYLSYKARYAAKYLEKPPFLIDRVSRWKTVKLFLSGLWQVWCEMDGIACGMPYAIGILGHDGAHYIAPPRPELFDGKM